MSGEGADGSDPNTTPMLDEVKETTVICRCGKGSSDTIVIPKNTQPGDYVLEVCDGVLSSCLSSSTNTENSDSSKVVPGCAPVELKHLCSWVPRLATSTEIKIIVTD